jgi:hypothetical protein
MAETVLHFPRLIPAQDGTGYVAHVCGAQMSDDMWQGWIEFIPEHGGEPVRSGRETTQPNRTDLVYWATGLTDVYLEGSLQRALQGPVVVPVERRRHAPLFPGPAPSSVTGRSRGEASASAILDPFSVYEKSEGVLRRQLGALSARHLVNIALEYGLTDLDVQTLNEVPAGELIDLIVRAVRLQTARPHTA